MTPPRASLALLGASSDLLNKISKGFNDYILNGPVPLGTFLLGVAVLVGAGVAWHYVAPHYLKRRETEALFHVLCERNELDADESRWLRDLAAQEGLENPATVFLLPSIVTKARREQLGRLTGGTRDNHEAFLARLHVRLFE